MLCIRIAFIWIQVLVDHYDTPSGFERRPSGNHPCPVSDNDTTDVGFKTSVSVLRRANSFKADQKLNTLEGCWHGRCLVRGGNIESGYIRMRKMSDSHLSFLRPACAFHQRTRENGSATGIGMDGDGLWPVLAADLARRGMTEVMVGY